MDIVSIYRISDNSNREKIKPDYASKHNCLRTFVREFGRENLIVLCDNVSDETFNMVHEFVDADNIHRTSNGNTGSFIASWDLGKRIAEQYGDDIIIYFVEDDYIHRRGAKQILIEGFRDLDANYVTLYDHPDKYQNFKDERFTWDHGKQDEDINGVRVPKHIYKQGLDCKLYISKSTHWRTVGSTTMTWACRGKDIIEDFKEMWDVHYNKHLPMGGDTFRMLEAKGKSLISCVPSYAAHGEEKWLPYFINWKEEAKS
tara:strand:- start:1565 stop:2338 length:774 start_codon:yes stop_codon:yes gene_type:complete